MFIFLQARKTGFFIIGVTNNLIKRIYEHKNEMTDGFTKKYYVRKLVHYEQTNDINSAIQREKQLNKWHRQDAYDTLKKLRLLRHRQGCL